MVHLPVRVRSAIVFGAIFLGGYCLSLFFSKHIFSVLLGMIFLFILSFEWPQLCQKDWKMWLLTPFYPVLPMIALIFLNHAYSGMDFFLPLYPFFVCWAADTGGYEFGVRWGRHKIAPKISPKKSWEGFLGSCIFVFLLHLILLPFLFFGFFPLLERLICGSGWLIFILLPVLFAFVAFAGDLFESYFKRRAGIKDSGVIMPGHGGLLDRFDSVLFVGVLILAFL